VQCSLDDLLLSTMMCSRVVFRCFKALERLGDRITGAAGPFFVAFAVILISLGTVCFCQLFHLFPSGNLLKSFQST
jgi:hypothetical protein